MEMYNLQENQPPSVPLTEPTTWTLTGRLMWMTAMTVSITNLHRETNTFKSKSYETQVLQLQLLMHSKPSWKCAIVCWLRFSHVQLCHLETHGRST